MKSLGCGSSASLSSVSTGAPAALAALTAASTRMVSLTITEKGYDPEPDELEHPGGPATAAGVLAFPSPGGENPVASHR